MKHKPKEKKYVPFKPIEGKEYLLTDSCFFEQNAPANYNPYDKKRSPHGIQLVDLETGTTVNLVSGSIVRIVKSNPTLR